MRRLHRMDNQERYRLQQLRDHKHGDPDGFLYNSHGKPVIMAGRVLDMVQAEFEYFEYGEGKQR